jgi:hypothetical protein
MRNPHAEHRGPTMHEPRHRWGPLHGLSALQSVALVGADALLADADAPAEWSWRGIVQRGDVTEIAGPPYCGKSTLTIFVAVAHANPGEPIELFGRVVTPIEPGRFVVLINVENSQRSAKRKLREACELLGLPVRETLDPAPRCSHARNARPRRRGNHRQSRSRARLRRLERRTKQRSRTALPTLAARAALRSTS